MGETSCTKIVLFSFIYGGSARVRELERLKNLLRAFPVLCMRLYTLPDSESPSDLTHNHVPHADIPVLSRNTVVKVVVNTLYYTAYVKSHSTSTFRPSCESRNQSKQHTPKVLTYLAPWARRTHPTYMRCGTHQHTAHWTYRTDFEPRIQRHCTTFNQH